MRERLVWPVVAVVILGACFDQPPPKYVRCPDYEGPVQDAFRDGIGWTLIISGGHWDGVGDEFRGGQRLSVVETCVISSAPLRPVASAAAPAPTAPAPAMHTDTVRILRVDTVRLGPPPPRDHFIPTLVAVVLLGLGSILALRVTRA